MKDKNIVRLIIFKIACCGILLFFLMGGLGLLAGLSTGNIILSGLGIIVLLVGVYKISLTATGKRSQ